MEAACPRHCSSSSSSSGSTALPLSPEVNSESDGWNWPPVAGPQLCFTPQERRRKRQWEWALELLEEERQRKSVPDPCAYGIAIEACCKAERFDWVLHLCEEMKLHGLQPSSRSEHAFSRAQKAKDVGLQPCTRSISSVSQAEKTRGIGAAGDRASSKKLQDGNGDKEQDHMAQLQDQVVALLEEQERLQGLCHQMTPLVAHCQRSALTALQEKRQAKQQLIKEWQAMQTKVGEAKCQVKNSAAQAQPRPQGCSGRKDCNFPPQGSECLDEGARPAVGQKVETCGILWEAEGSQCARKELCAIVEAEDVAALSDDSDTCSNVSQYSNCCSVSSIASGSTGRPLSDAERARVELCAIVDSEETLSEDSKTSTISPYSRCFSPSSIASGSTGRPMSPFFPECLSASSVASGSTGKPLSIISPECISAPESVASGSTERPSSPVVQETAELNQLPVKVQVVENGAMASWRNALKTVVKSKETAEAAEAAGQEILKLLKCNLNGSSSQSQTPMKRNVRSQPQQSVNLEPRVNCQRAWMNSDAPAQLQRNNKYRNLTTSSRK